MPSDTLNTGPVGTGEHIVQQGECFLSIASQHGFYWMTLWDHPANQELRSIRKIPGQLLPGDRIMIPERELKTVPAATDARHKYVKRGATAKLRLVVEYEDLPIPNAPYVVTVDGLALQGTTDENGLLEQVIPSNAAQGTLDIKGLHFDLQLGALDPHSEDIGIQQRLANLGYYRGKIDGIIGPMTREAIADFQSRTGLSVTGKLDDSTRNMLLHRHDENHEKLSDPAGDSTPANPPPPDAAPAPAEVPYG